MIQLNNGNKKILQIAIPSIVSNITVPLLGLIDVTIVGHLGSAAYIGAIAVGGMLFNIIYWIYNANTYNCDCCICSFMRRSFLEKREEERR